LGIFRDQLVYVTVIEVRLSVFQQNEFSFRNWLYSQRILRKCAEEKNRIGREEREKERGREDFNQ